MYGKTMGLVYARRDVDQNQLIESSETHVQNPGWLMITHMLHVWNICQHLPEQNHPNVGKYTIHGAYGLWLVQGLYWPSYWVISESILEILINEAVYRAGIISSLLLTSPGYVFHFYSIDIYIYIKYKFEVVCGSQIFIAESSPFSGPLKRGRLHELQKRYEEPPPLLNDKSSIYRRFHSYSKCVCMYFRLWTHMKQSMLLQAWPTGFKLIDKPHYIPPVISRINPT